jgi:hypothetical protein
MPRIQLVNVCFRAIALHRLRPQSRAPHELRDASPPDGPAQRLQDTMEARTAVAGGMQGEPPHDLLGEEPVLYRMAALRATTLGIESARGHPVAPTQRRHAASRPRRVDEGERVALRAEQNRMAFFRRSCSSCSSAWAFSSACSWAISRAGPGGSVLRARPRMRPSRTSFRHLDSMKGWISSAAATVCTCKPGC